MTSIRTVLLMTVSVVLSACSLPPPTLPETPAAQQLGPSYGYRPLDPLSASLQHSAKVPVTNCRILELFPDETVRLAVGQLDASGNISYGVAKAGYQGNRYTVVLDYIKSDTRALSATGGTGETAGRQVPTYVGIGLRLSANLTVNSGTVDLANLIAIGAAAQAKQLSGTLVIQTLGISGESIASAIPIPSEISASSIQNALVAIGTIKSKIYDDKTSISPRVIGIYDTFGGDTKAFDAFFVRLLNNPPSVTERENSSHCPAAAGAPAAAAAGTAQGTGEPPPSSDSSSDAAKSSGTSAGSSGSGAKSSSVEKSGGKGKRVKKAEGAS